MSDHPGPTNLISELDKGLLIGLVLPVLGFLAWLRVQCVQALTLDPTWLATLELLRSHLLGYAAFLALATAAFLIAPRRPLVWVVRGGVLGCLAVLAFYEYAVYQLYVSTHTVADWSLALYFLGNLRETLIVVQSQGRPVLWTVGTLGALATVGAALWLAERHQGDEDRARLLPRRFRVAGATLLGALILALGAAIPPATGAAPASLGRSVPLHLAWSALGARYELPAWARELEGHYPEPAIAPRDDRDRPLNLVVIALESTRARSVTAYDSEVGTTPFLAELAEGSLLAEYAYANFTHTTKAMLPLHCSIHPVPSMEVHESAASGHVPVPCLAELLADQGYATVFFRSATEHFEGWRQLVDNLGFAEFYPSESLDTEGFQRANYFGYEDAILLEPSERWLRAREGQPFFAFYMTGTPHHDYLAPTRYGRHDFHPDPETNLYLNSIWYLDHFLRELFDQYRRLGLYDDTVFVLMGDHGESLGEHKVRYHNDCPYQECVRVPLIVHHAGRWSEGVRLTQRIDQLDIAPTALDLLGFEVQPGAQVGRSFLDRDAPGRTTFVSCWYDRKCIASVRDRVKYVHFFDDTPDEMYDLEADPAETIDMTDARPAQAAERRAELLEWYYRTKGRYLSFLEDRASEPAAQQQQAQRER